MKKILFTLFFFPALLSQFNCNSNSTEPETTANYMSLSVGDIREYYDSTMGDYQIWEIIGKTKRSDSTEVFIGKWLSSMDTTYQGTVSYYAIRGNYFVSTELEKTNNSENPYFEQRLAEINPKDGDRWIDILGVPDSEITYFTAKYVGKYKTPASEFKDVYGYTLADYFTVYYANDFGHIATGDSTFGISINYAKINGREIGKFMPLTKPNLSTIRKSNKHFRKVNFLGQVIE